MKRRILALLLACLTVVSLWSAPALAAESGASTEISDMTLVGNAGGNYVAGNGMRNSPGRSWLYANEKGGVTLVQYVSSSVGVTVAEFDRELNFLNTRALPVEGISKWGGFCAGETYNYVVYATGSNTLRIDQYSKEWSLTNTRTYTLGNTRSMISNDLDIAEGGGSLFIVSNHYMSDGHQANFRLQVNAANLALQVEQTGTASYNGYCSHSYVPEVVYSGGTVYAFDRCDSVPGTAIYMSVFGGSLNSGIGMRSVKSMLFNDWGSQGNAIPAAGGGVLTAYTFANWNAANTSTDVYLYYASSSSSYGSSVRVSYTGGAGTPYVAAVTDSYGYVLWNTDAYDSTQAKDNLYCAVYTINSGSVTVGAVRKVEGHYLSDCEPIDWDGGLLWYTYEGGEIVFHWIGADGEVTKTRIHRPVTVAGTAATCTEDGLTDGQKCSACGEILVEQEKLPAAGHTEVKTDYVAPTFTSVGYTEGVKCSVCGEQLSGGEEIPMLTARVEEVREEDGTLRVLYRNDWGTNLIVAYYNKNGQFMGTEMRAIRASSAGNMVFFPPEGSYSCRVMIVDEDWVPRCEAYHGLL